MLIAAVTRLGCVVRTILVMVVAAGILLLAAGLGLAWRLSQGPLDVGWAARRIEAAANDLGRPTRLSIGEASVRWNGYADDTATGLDLTLRDVQLATLDEKPVAKVGTFEMTVSMARLLLGQVVPRTITVSGVDASLLRDADGDVSLDLGGLSVPDDTATADTPGPTLRETLAELARPPRRPGTRPARPDLQHIEELQRVQMRDTTLHLHDPALGSAVRLDILALDLLRRDRGGVHGTAAATITLGTAHSTVAAHADLLRDGGTRVQVAFAPVNATTVQSGEPALATETVLDAAIQGGAMLELDARLRPRAATLQLDAGGGRMRLADGVIGFDSLSLGAQAAWNEGQEPPWRAPEHLTVSRIRAVVHAPGGTWPTTINASGHLNRTPTGYAGDAEGTLDHVNFADVGLLWPKKLGGHIRPWLVPNVTAGTARDGSVKMSFEAPADFSDITLKSIDASAKGEGVTIWWLRPVPPVEGAQAVLTFNNPATMDIAVSSAHQGPLALSNGLIHFTGMDEKDQFMALGANIAGSVPELLKLLGNPTLQLLSRSPIPIHNPAGAMTGHLGVNMPMKDVVEFDDIRIQTTAKATGLHLGALVAGRDLDRGTIQVDANSDQFHAAGPAIVGGIPADLVMDMDFRGGGPAQIVQKASATARATAGQLAKAGLDPGALMPSGAGQFVGRFTQRRDGSGDVVVTGDLRDAALVAPGWTKAPGQPADLTARLLLRGDHMVGVDQLHAKGPGMAVDGHLQMLGDQPSLLVLDRLALGRTQAAGTVRFPAIATDPIRATIAGTVLDLSTLKGKTPDQPAPPDPPWVADIRFDSVLLAATTPGLAGLVAHAENDGRHVTAMTLSTSGPEQLQATIRREGNGRHLVLKAADAGALLRSADVIGTVRGGLLSIDAMYDDTQPSSPLAGTAQARDFTVRDAPILGKLLQAVTIYGVVDALRGPGLVFSDLVLPFRWDGGVLQLTDARAFSASLGLTAHGRIDTGHGTLDLQGTVVPAYVINAMLGRIPLIGRLFSAEQGGGLVAMDYGLHGPLANPAVRVNPLSALTPGFLRGLFHIFD